MSKITKAQFNPIIEHELPWAVDAGMRLQSVESGKAVMEVSLFSQKDIVAHATGTYSIPPER
jgi:hypothetical protein